MYHIAVAGFIHETNTFSPLPTPYEAFAIPNGMWPGLLRGQMILKLIEGKRLNLCGCGFAARAKEFDFALVPLAYTSAEPSRQVSASAFERIMGVITASLSDAMPVDGVYLDLHGAMVYEDFNDGETEIIRRVRAIVGADIPIVVSYDLHGNITPQCFELASGMIGYRTYPHTDMYETGERCAALLHHLLEGKKVYKTFRQVPYLIPISRQSTNTEPARSIYDEIAALEKDPALLSATLMMGFPPADIFDMGPSIFTYALNQEKADQAAQHLYDQMLKHESDFALQVYSAKDAVKKAIELSHSASRPVILADVQDNSGGGATSDTVGILEELIKQQAEGVALGLLFDAEAAALAHQVGEGKEITLDLGGKLMPGDTPLHATFRVEKISEGTFPATGPMSKGMQVNLGRMAQLRIGGVRVVVSSVRTQANDQSYFRQVGIEPAEMKILVLKSANHYRADFEPISSIILPVESPGAIIEDPAKAAYHNLRKGVRLNPNGPLQK